jgi:6-phosphogluconolactonase
MSRVGNPLAGSSGAGAPGVRLHRYADETQLVAGVTAVMAEALEADRRAFSPGVFLLSGGSTPAPIYRALAARLDDADRLTVSLVDDRWIAPGKAGSNAQLIRETLLSGPASPPRFWPLVDWERGLETSVAQANARLRSHLQAYPRALSLLLLGMGEDGHTASLFPGSADLLPALAASTPYVAVDATGCAGAGAWPRRISLTPIGWKTAQRRLLVIRGERKWRILERALHERDVVALPVCAALTLGDAPLDVHWAP